MPQKLAASPNKARSGNGDEPADTSNKSEMLVIASIESENPDSGEIPRVRLGSVHWHADDANGPRDQADVSKGQVDELEGRTDESRAQADASNTSNEAKTVVVSHRTGAGTYLSTGDAKRAVDETDGIGSHADASSGHRDALNASNNAERGGISNGDEPTTYLGAADAKRGADATDGIASHADASNGQTDAPSVQTDTLMAANAPETVSTHPIEPQSPNSPVGDSKRGVDVADGLASHTDTSSEHMDPPSVETDALTSRNAPNTVSIPRTKPKTPDLPGDGARLALNEQNGWGSHTDTSSAQTGVPGVHTDAITPADEVGNIRTQQNRSKMQNSPLEAARQRSDEPNACRNLTDRSGERASVHSVANETETPANGMERVRTRRNGSKSRNSPNTRKTATPELTSHCKRVSAGGIIVYIPLNAPIDDSSRMFVFGRVEGGEEAIAPKVIDETAGNGDGDRNGGGGAVNGTTSSGNVDSTRVEAALLATDSQQTRSGRITRKHSLPVSSEPPIQPAEQPYGLIRRQLRRGKLKIERINDKGVSQMPEVETTHPQRVRFAQPHENPSRRRWEVHRPIHQRGTLKVERINVSRMPRAETTHLARTHAAQPRGNPSKYFHRVYTPIHRRGRPTIERINISQVQKSKTTHLEYARAAQPPNNVL